MNGDEVITIVKLSRPNLGQSAWCLIDTFSEVVDEIRRVFDEGRVGEKVVLELAQCKRSDFDDAPTFDGWPVLALAD